MPCIANESILFLAIADKIIFRIERPTYLLPYGSVVRGIVR